MPNANQPLALTNESFAAQKGWRRNQELVDALPYIDGLQASEKDAVNALIEKEMMEIEKKPSDYLDELPPVPHSRLDGDDLLRNELQRASRGESLSAMDLERYNLNPPPPNQRSDPAAWQAALDNAHAQLEHQRNRQLNLELLLKFGPITWRAHNEALVSFLDRIKADVTATRGAIDQLNRERKLQQTAAGRELQILEEEYTGLLLKTAELETACRAVESETNSAHSQMPAIALT